MAKKNATAEVPRMLLEEADPTQAIVQQTLQQLLEMQHGRDAGSAQRRAVRGADGGVSRRGLRAVTGHASREVGVLIPRDRQVRADLFESYRRSEKAPNIGMFGHFCRPLGAGST